MTDMRRTLLWVVFLMSLVLLWDAWGKHSGQPSLFGSLLRPSVTAKPAAPSASAPALSGASGVPLASGAGAPAAPVGAAVLPSAAIPPSGERVTLTTDVVKATFDSQGGSLIRLELLAFLDDAAASHHVVLMDQSAQRLYAAQTGLITTQAGVALPNHLTAMTVVPGERTLALGAQELTLKFESPLVDDRKLIKTYTIKRGEYTMAVRHEFVNQGTTPVVAQLYLQLARDGNIDGGPPSMLSPASTFTGPAMYSDASKYKKIEFADIAKGKVEHDKVSDSGWVAMVQHYFASAWLVPTAGPREFRTAKIGDNEYTIALVMPLGEVAPGTTRTLDATLFAGPQEETKIAALAPGLHLVKDYGWLRVLSEPLFWLLNKLHGFIGNWGWAIVALVVLLKIAFYWLNASAYKSMGKMKAVAPKVAELKERYKDKPQEMQAAMMKIYKEEKVNPLGGCLPIFVQMPFFIALYWVLLSSVEMRNAPWVGWITDLSVKDPWYILPVLMTLSSLFQVWLNPAPPDPIQAKMMWIMPLAFGVMFFFFPAGLVLYWLTNNILSIAQQWFINKQLGVLGK